jgi:opacity protein-like surface antigen
MLLRLLVPLILLAPSLAQTTETYGTQRREFSTWTSFSVGGNGHIFGFAQNRSLYLTGIRYGWTIAHWNKLGGMNLRYAPEIIPTAYLRDRVVNGQPVALDQFAFPAVPADEYVYGGGVNPVGLQMNFRRGKRIQPLWEFEGGFLYFTRPVLTFDGSQFQFAVATGPGAQFYINPRTALTVGYRYHHMSNANISGHNPGTDTQQIYFSFSLFR